MYIVSLFIGGVGARAIVSKHIVNSTLPFGMFYAVVRRSFTGIDVFGSKERIYASSNAR